MKPIQFNPKKIIRAFTAGVFASCTPLAVVLILTPTVVHAEKENELRSVEAEGEAPGDAPNARVEALTSALREAVRVGVGVNVVDQSQVKDFQLDFDRVFTASMGYVRNYKIVSSALDVDGIYRVKIKADVAAGTPESNDSMIFKMLARSRQSPRLMIELDEKINGQSGSTTGTEWFARAAKDFGIPIVTGAPQGGDVASKRAAILKRGTEAEMRAADLVSSCDYILRGTITTNSAEPKEIHDTMRRICSVDIGLQIIDPISRNVVVSDTLEARRFALEEALSPEVACREAIRRALEEPPDESTVKPGNRAIRMLFTHWIAEMDLGSIFKVELTGLDLDAAESLRTALAGRDKVGAVWVRSIDPAGVSVVDVESRLDGLVLAKSIAEASGNKYQLDRSDNRYISMRPKDLQAEGSESVENVFKNEKSAKTHEETSEKKFPILPVSGGAAVLVGLAFTIRKLMTKNNV
jgi:hypothetical protein